MTKYHCVLAHGGTQHTCTAKSRILFPELLPELLGVVATHPYVKTHHMLKLTRAQFPQHIQAPRDKPLRFSNLISACTIAQNIKGLSQGVFVESRSRGAYPDTCLRMLRALFPHVTFLATPWPCDCSTLA